MARIKSPVINSHPNPQSTNPIQHPDRRNGDESPLAASPQPLPNQTCQHCGADLSTMSASEFNNHVGNCSNPVMAPPASGYSSPLSSLSRSPTPVPGFQIAQVAPEENENNDAEDNGGIHQEDEDDAHPEAEDQDTQSVSEQGLTGHQTDDRVINGATLETDPTSRGAAFHPGYPTISAYVIARKEVVDGEEIVEHALDYYEDIDDEFGVGLQDGGIDTNENGIASTPATEKDGSTPTDSQEIVTDAEVDTQPAILSEDHVSKSLSSEPTFANPAKLTSKSKPSNTKFAFQRLTTAEEFTDYLANTQYMAFDELYYRTSQTANALKAIQDEYDRLDFLTKEDEVWQKTQMAEAKLAAKLDEEEKLRDEEPELIKILAKYEDALKQREKGWKQSLVELQKDGLSAETHPETWERLMKLRNDTKLRADMTEKMIRARQADAGSIRNLVDVPLPKLTAEDLKNPKVKKRDYLEPPVKWNDRKQMDAYGLPYSAAEARVGNQELRDRNAVDENGDALYENGRPRRNRAKRALYDSQQPSKEASPEAAEVLPAKRKRTVRNPGDADELGGDANSGAQTPAPKVFKSGKRVGRPPKGFTKSKLNEAHVPPASGAAEEEDPSQSADEEEPAEKHRGARSQVLESSQEIDLIDSATALVEQTLSEQGPATIIAKGTAVGSKHPKGKGGRPAKVQQVDENVSEPVPVIQNRGGRPKRKPAPRALSSPFVEDDDILQSTEQDDQSQYASAPTSRPTTASTHQTRSTLNSRANSRPQENGAAGDEDMLDNEVTGVSTRRRGGKRKANGAEGPGNGDDFQPIGPPSKKRKVSAKRQNLPASEEPAEVTEESRPKRKRQATVADSIEVLRPEAQDDADDEEALTKTKRRPRNAALKTKAVKLETESDFEDDDELPPRKKARTAAKKGKAASKLPLAQDDDEAVDKASGESDEDDIKSEPDTKKPRPSTKGGKAKKTASRKPKTKGDGDEVEEIDMDPEAFEELQRKKAQKSAKLSASAKARWAKGLMKEPMEKRAATNAAKKAARKAGSAAKKTGPAAKKTGSGSVAGTGDASMAATANGDEKVTASQQSVAQAPVQPPAFSEGVFQAAPQPPTEVSESTPAASAPTRKTKRPRKPTLKTNKSMGMDGAEDDEMLGSTIYEQFQAISSPGSS